MRYEISGNLSNNSDTCGVKLKINHLYIIRIFLCDIKINVIFIIFLKPKHHIPNIHVLKILLTNRIEYFLINLLAIYRQF